MELSIIGVNTQKEKQFNKKGIYTVEDLLKYTPRKYFDYRKPKTVSELIIGENTAIIGEIVNLKVNTEKKYVMASIKDENNDRLEVIWFHEMYVAKMLIVGEKYIFCGKINENKLNHKPQMSNPIFSYDIDKYKTIFPVYKKIAGMSDDYLKSKIKEGLDAVYNQEYLSFSILQKYNLVRTFEMARSIHQPRNEEDIAKAERRIIFDSLFRMAFNICYTSNACSENTDINVPNASTVKQFEASLPFSLTDGEGGQLYVTRQIYKKMRAGKKTTSLVQGDVGCGKTMVAMLLMLIMAENGYQSVLMAPTNVLAKQHFEEFTKRLEMFPFVKTAFINGTMTKREKTKTLEAIKTGEVNIIIGTHAVISKDVEFKNLALSIVDEEHRFGVAQRQLLKEKTSEIHQVTMSATPIPRSLGLAIYGENTDIYSITQMPAGRKKVVTKVVPEINQCYDFIEREVSRGRQAYVICPLIDESDSERLEGVESVTETYNEIKKYFAGKNINIGVINGKMKAKEVNEEIDKFNKREYDVIISTTIVEVGVNVPNATVILIKNAERFGLAQLHQLRGRVGRGSHQSYCLLCTPKDQVERLDIMEETNDGFVIAEKDLELRGMGDFIGTSQTGSFKDVMLMLANKSLYQDIRLTVYDILKDPAQTRKYEFLLTSHDEEEEY